MTLQDIFNKIDAAITTNGSNAITGAILKEVLEDMATFSEESNNGEWQDSVKQIANGAPPSFPVDGDRYLINNCSGVWEGKAGQIAEWDTDKWVYTQPTNNMYVKVDTGGAIYFHDGVYVSDTWNWSVDFNQTNAVLSLKDKYHVAIATSGDGQPAVSIDSGGLEGNPLINSYVSVFINGQEYEVGDGVIDTACYFVPAAEADNSENHSAVVRSMTDGANLIQAGDILIWNDTIAGTSIQEGWRISMHYLESTNT